MTDQSLFQWKPFAKTLFALEDADPIYYALARAKMSVDQKRRFMVGWTSYYNPGIAAAASEFLGSRFYQYLILQYKTAKRGSERRHFRGTAGMDAITSWRDKWPEPEGLVLHMVGKDYFEVREHAKDVRLVGLYMTFKYADCQDRIFGIPCIFPPECAKFTSKVPQAGAKLIKPDWEVGKTYAYIENYMNKEGMLAPPDYKRAMLLPEAETVCCIFHQFVSHRWWPHSRTAKATRSLLATPSDTSELMLKALHEKTGVKRKEMAAWQEDILGDD